MNGAQRGGRVKERRKLFQFMLINKDLIEAIEIEMKSSSL
jgi:hypothetical protein